MTDVSTRVRAQGPGNSLTVFVHGYLATGGVMKPMAEHLAAQGVGGRHLHFNFAPAGSLAEHVRKLDALIEKIHGVSGPVNLVGHSLGGLVARYYRQVLGRPVARMVCIATPHEGVPRARVFRALPLVDELAPGSSTLKLLEATRSRLDGTVVTCVLPSHDNLVSPNGSASLMGTRSVRVEGVGHLAVLFDKQTWSIVADALR
ncbi:MAG: hypothetical protein Q8Q09_28760 [Deltaproteobacteria bacterium]|nr:hypothetical protein [Deltaproteobacteria bacterium]